ncbi:MAG: acyl-CoA thioesterase [Solirubrobacterales bacterium]
MTAATTHEVQMRWQDLDALGHVNHNVVLTYLEEGRDAFLGARGIGRDNYVVGGCSITYLAEIEPGQGLVTVECGVSELGDSSVRTSERVLGPGGEVLVEAEFALVLWDPDSRGSRPITAAERSALSEGSGEG